VRRITVTATRPAASTAKRAQRDHQEAGADVIGACRVGSHLSHFALNLGQCIQLLDQLALQWNAFALQLVESEKGIALHRQIDGPHHHRLVGAGKAVDALEHFLFARPDGQFFEFEADLLIGRTKVIETQHLLVFFERIAGDHDGQHGDRAVAQDVAHLVGKPAFDAVFLHDGFKMRVGRRQLMQTEKDQRDDQRQCQGEAGADGRDEFAWQIGDSGGHGGSRG
jgi:hypothetical protein